MCTLVWYMNVKLQFMYQREWVCWGLEHWCPVEQRWQEWATRLCHLQTPICSSSSSWQVEFLTPGHVAGMQGSVVGGLVGTTEQLVAGYLSLTLLLEVETSVEVQRHIPALSLCRSGRLDFADHIENWRRAEDALFKVCSKTKQAS